MVDARLQKLVAAELDRLRKALEYPNTWERYNYALGRLHGAAELWLLVAEHVKEQGT